MKKKILKTLSIMIASLALMAVGVGCGIVGGNGNSAQTGHTHEYKTFVTLPTCTAQGYTTYTCDCGDSYTDDYVRASHTEVIDKAVAATCTNSGLTEGRHCSACGEVFLAQETVPAIGGAHTLVIQNAVEPTCIETGLTSGAYCSSCNAVLVAQTTVAALGHTEVWTVEKEASCGEAGSKYSTCSTCKEKVSTATIPALEHTYTQTVNALEGYILHTCDNCGDNYRTSVSGATTLAYTVNEDNKTCTVTGLGEWTEAEVHIPSAINGYTVTAIAEKAFAEQTAITALSLPDTVKTIGTRAFYGCTGLTEITIPSSVTSIGTQIFYKAENLHTVYYNSRYANKDNPFMDLAHIKNVVFGGTYVPSNIFYNYTSEKSVTIKNTVKSIGDSAFYNCSSLMSVEIPDSVTSIDSSAFRGCSSLTSVKIPDSVTRIGKYAFRDCTSLTSVVISDSVTSVGDSAFWGCSSLTSVEIPDSVTSINWYAFYNCSSLTSVVIPDSVTSIGDFAFYDCYRLTDVYYTGDIESWCKISGLGDLMSYGSFNKKLYLNNQLVTNLVIPDSVTSINWYAFRGCSNLTSVEIPDSVTSIGNYAFEHCSSLTSVEIPDSVTSIGDYAFRGCSNLTSVYYKGTAEEWNQISIDSSGNSYLTDATRYYYSETEPTVDGNWWHYVDGVVTVWE